MEKEKGLKRRDFIKATGVGIAVAGLDLFSSGARAQEQKALEKRFFRVFSG